MSGLAGMREYFSDGRWWLFRGLVTVHAGDDSHYEINDDGDIEVSVVTADGATPVSAILLSIGGKGRGFWAIPQVGTEVLCLCPDDFEGDIFLVAAAPSRSTPDELDEDTAVVVSPTIRLLGDTVHVGAAPTEKMIKGETYRGSEDTMLGLVQAAMTAVAALCTALAAPPAVAIGPAAQTAAGAAATAATSAATGVATFTAGAAGYLAQHGKVS